MTIHVDRDNAGELLGQRTHLRVFAACDPTEILAEGEFVGYNPAPTVVLRQADGTLSAWQTTLPMEEITAAAYDHDFEPACVAGPDGKVATPVCGHVTQDPDGFIVWFCTRREFDPIHVQTSNGDHEGTHTRG